MENNLIVVKQLPIIEDQLRQVKASVDARVAQALALACTEETYKDVKKARAELNKEFQDLEARRREVKKAILAPYEAFEKLYKECAADAFTKADAELKPRSLPLRTASRARSVTKSSRSTTNTAPA